MNKEEQKRRGDSATRIMNDPLVVETLEKMEQSILKLWIDCGDKETRDRLWYTYQGAVTFRDAFKSMIVTGKFSEKELLNKHKDSLLKKVVNM